MATNQKYPIQNPKVLISMKKAIPYLLIFVIMLIVAYFCERRQPEGSGKPIDSSVRDSLTAVIGTMITQRMKDTTGNYAAVKAQDSVIQHWRNKALHQLVKTVVIRVREQVPEIDSALIAYDSMDLAYQGQINILKYQLESSIKFGMMLHQVEQVRDTVSQGMYNQLRLKYDSLVTRNGRLVKTNRRLWTGNAVQAALHVARSLD